MKLAIAVKIILLLTIVNLFDSWDDDYFLMPYRSGNKWGLCDTTGIVKVQPTYDGFVDMIVDSKSKQSFYFVKQGNRTIVIDHNNVQQLKQYDSVSPGSFRIYKGGKIGIYNYNPGSLYNGTIGSFVIVAEPIYDKIKPIMNHAYIITVKGKQGLLYMDYKTSSIPLRPEYDKIIFEKPFFKAYKGGKVTGIFKDPIYSSGSADIAPEAANNENQKAAAQKKDQEERARLIKNLKQDLSADELKKIMPFEITPIHKYVKYREGDKQGYANFSYSLQGGSKRLVKNMVMPAIYDSISEAGTYKFLLKQGEKYGFYFSGRTVVPTEYDDIKFHSVYTDEILLKKNGKYAVYHFNSAKILTGFEFDSYSFIPKSENQYFTVLHKGSNKLLWDNSIAGEEYDDLVPYNQITSNKNQKSEFPGYFKIKKNGRYGLLYDHQTIIPAAYDDVISEYPEFQTTIDNGKKGAYQQNYFNVPPRYKSIKLFKKFYIANNHYFLFKVETTSGIHFYTDKNGREFKQ
jgi:hypothetical protein